MKRVLVFLSIIVIVAFATWSLKSQIRQEDKRYKVEMTMPEWLAKLDQIEWIKLQIKQSDIPSKNAVFAVDSFLTPLTQQIAFQINMQLRAEQNAKSIKIDTTKPKNK